MINKNMNNGICPSLYLLASFEDGEISTGISSDAIALG